MLKEFLFCFRLYLLCSTAGCVDFNSVLIMDLELECYSEDEWEDKTSLHTFPITSPENESCVQTNAETKSDLILCTKTGNFIYSVSNISQWCEQSSNDVAVPLSEKVLEYINPLNQIQNVYCTERQSEADIDLNQYLNSYAETRVSETGSPECDAEANSDLILSPKMDESIYSNSEIPQLCKQSFHDDVTLHTVNKGSVPEYRNTQNPSQYSCQCTETRPVSIIRESLVCVAIDHNYSKNPEKVNENDLMPVPFCRFHHDHSYYRLRGGSIIHKTGHRIIHEIKSFHTVSFNDNQTISVMCAFCSKTFNGVDQFLDHVEVPCNTNDLSEVPYAFTDLVMNDSKVRYAQWFFCSVCATVFSSLEPCRYHIRRCFAPHCNKWQNNLKLYLLSSCKVCGEKGIRTTRAADVIDLDTKERLLKMTFSCKCHHSEHLMNPKRSQSFSLLSLRTAESLIPLCSSVVSSQCHDSLSLVNSSRNEGLPLLSKSKDENVIPVHSCAASSKANDSKNLVNSNKNGVSLLSKRRAECHISVSFSVTGMGDSTVKLTKGLPNSSSSPLVVYHSLKIDLDASIDLETDTYECGFCDKQFSTVQSFNSHVGTCPHKKKGYRSPVCITFSNRTWSRALHTKSMCEYCISLFDTHNECLMHMDKCCFKTRNFPNIQFAVLRLCKKCKRRQIKISDRTTDMMEMIRAYSDSEQQDIPVCDISNIKSRCNQLCIKNPKTLTVEVENRNVEIANTIAGKVNQMETIVEAKNDVGMEIDLESKSNTDAVSDHQKQQDGKNQSQRDPVDDIKSMHEINSHVPNIELQENAIESVLNDKEMKTPHSDNFSTQSENCELGEQLTASSFTRNLQTGSTCSGKSTTNCKSRYAFHQVNMTNQLIFCGYCQEYFRTAQCDDFLQHVNLCQKLNESIILPVQFTHSANRRFMCGFCSQTFICVCFAITHMKQCALTFPLVLEGKFLNIKYRLLPYCKRHNMKRVPNIDELDEDLRVFLQGHGYKSPRICECTENQHVARQRKKTRTKRKRISKRESWTCFMCGEIFYNKVIFNIHGDVHSNKSTLCHICGKSGVKKLTKHLRNSHSINYRGDLLRKRDRSYYRKINWESLCHICGTLVRSRRNLQYHLEQRCSRQKPYECQYCRKKFSYKCSHAFHIKGCIMKITYR